MGEETATAEESVVSHCKEALGNKSVVSLSFWKIRVVGNKTSKGLDEVELEERGEEAETKGLPRSL